MSEGNVELGGSNGDFGDEKPRIAVISDSGTDLSGRIEAAGGEAFHVSVPGAPEEWGVALVREWLADLLEVELSALRPDALIFEADGMARASAALISAVRLKIPAVSLLPTSGTLGAALATLGLTPLAGEDPVEVAVEIIGDKKLTSTRIIDSLALANALRVGTALGAGPELLLHLSAIGKEADVVGFPRMARVLIPETVSVTTSDSDWYLEYGLPGLLDYLSEDLNDTLTVCGALKEAAAEDAPSPEGARIVHEFVRARSSGAEVLCRVPEGVAEISGKCLVFDSEADAVENLSSRLSEFYEERRTELSQDDEEPEDEGSENEVSENGSSENEVSEDEESENEVSGTSSVSESRAVETSEEEYVEEAVIAVVRGCGPRAVPGVRVLEDLDRAMVEQGLYERVSVMTDGLAPEGAAGLWASVFSPEAASGGVIGKLADGDFLKVDLDQGRILTSVDGKEIARRRSFKSPSRRGAGYAKRYAKDAQPIVDGGAAFG